MMPTTAAATWQLTRAEISAAQAIHDLVNTFAAKGEMLPRTIAEVYENLRDLYVVRDDAGATVACGGLHILWADLAAIKSLAVREDLQGHGLGQRIDNACLDEARQIGLTTAFALFVLQAPFERLDVWKTEVPKPKKRKTKP